MDDSAALMLELGDREGPLDLLLALVWAQQVDARAIPILTLVEQYLHFIAEAQTLRLELVADYLVMAAWLAHLKSQMLLSRDPVAKPECEPETEPETEPEPEPAAPGWRLKRRLERLQAMRDAGAALMARDLLGRDVFARGAPEGVTTVRATAWHVDHFALLTAYGQVTARRLPVTHVAADPQVTTLAAALERLTGKLGQAGDWHPIEHVLPECSPRARRSALASSLLAALELARRGRVTLRQDAPFAPLYVKAAP